MAEYSKWANIKYQKSTQNAPKGTLLAKLIKEVMIAANTGDPEPDNNPRLRLAIQNAKGANVPKDKIERAIKKGSDEEKIDYLEVTYEGYAPQGIAVFVECSTDNLNRTVANIRSIFNHNGGRLAIQGSVHFLFERKGVFLLAPSQEIDFEQLELAMIEAGAEEIAQHEGYTNITCFVEDFANIQKVLDNFAIECEQAKLVRIPSNCIELDEEAAREVMKLIEKLEDNADVQNVYHNLAVLEVHDDLSLNENKTQNQA